MKYQLLFALALTPVCLPMEAGVQQASRYTALESPVRGASAMKAAGKMQVPQSRVPDDGREYTVVIEEDFSLCAAGNEMDPDQTVISTADFKIPASYTHTPGWGGRAIMQAGGAVCIGKYTDAATGKLMTGQIETPELDLHRNQGKAYVSFRAKLLPQEFDMITVRWVAQTDLLPTTGEEQTFSVSGLSWSKIDVELSDCPSNAVIQIYSDTHELLVDDIKVEQFQPEIDAPTALKWTDYTGDSFTANWTEVEGADHYVFNCFYIRREGTDDRLPDYKYVARDLNVSGTSHHLSGLDPTKVYYYYVRSAAPSGALSEESKVVEVLALTVPDGITIGDVTREGFGIEWSPVTNAEGYGVQVILDHKALEQEDYAILDEHFDRIENEGTIGQPYVNNIGYYDMDSYGMSRANWVMYEGGVINGALALHNYVSTYGEQYYGELVSPVMTIGQSTGEITIEADFATLDAGVRPYIQIAVPGVVDGQTTWVLGAGGEVAKSIGSDWTHVSVSYKVKPGLVRFSIGTTDGGWLYMDNLRISVGLPQGAVQRLPYLYDEVKTGLDAPSYYVNTPDRTQGDSYSFALMAARQRPGSYMIPVYVTSDWTDLIEVPGIEWSGISDAAVEAVFAARGMQGGIAINNASRSDITVLAVSGAVVARTSVPEAFLSLAPGLYIVVSADGAASKVIVK